MLPFGGIQVSVDGEVKDPHESLVYKSFMLSGIPNLAFAFGYTNSSWTLKVDLVCEHLCRLLAYMDQHGYTTVVPVCDDPTIEKRPMLDFPAGYILRSIDAVPAAGYHRPVDGGDELPGRPRAAAQGSGGRRALRFSTAAARSRPPEPPDRQPLSASKSAASWSGDTDVLHWPRRSSQRPRDVLQVQKLTGVSDKIAPH